MNAASMQQHAAARRGACAAPLAPQRRCRSVRAAAAASSSASGSSGAQQQQQQQQQQPAAQDAARRRFHEGVTMTAYEGNSFAVKFNQSGARVLVDPWLVGDLTFFEQGWAYVGRKRVLGPGRVNVEEVAAETDLILLSQVCAL